MDEPRACAWCSGPLPAGSRSSRVYCSSRCTNARAWAADKEGRRAAHKVWRDATADARHRELIAAKARACVECGSDIPVSLFSKNNRRFCSAKCRNAVAIREKAPSRAEANRRRRARLRSGGLGVSERDWRRLLQRHDNCCAYCGATGPLEMDHVVPLARGGRHSIGNVLPACKACNCSKRDDLLIRWRLGRPYARLATAS